MLLGIPLFFIALITGVLNRCGDSDRVNHELFSEGDALTRVKKVESIFHIGFVGTCSRKEQP